MMLSINLLAHTLPQFIMSLGRLCLQLSAHDAGVQGVSRSGGENTTSVDRPFVESACISIKIITS